MIALLGLKPCSVSRSKLSSTVVNDRVPATTSRARLMQGGFGAAYGTLNGECDQPEHRLMQVRSSLHQRVFTTYAGVPMKKRTSKQIRRAAIARQRNWLRDPGHNANAPMRDYVPQPAAYRRDHH